MIRLSPLLAYLSLLTLLTSAPALQAQPTTPASGRLVFRVEASPPEEVFNTGIRNSHPSEGTLSNYDILDHALGLVCGAGQRSPWISTTRSGSQVTEFLARQAARENDTSSDGNQPLIEAWVYTIQTDDSYLDVTSVMQQVIEAGERNQYGYGYSHVRALQGLLQQTAINTRAEVLTTHIAPSRIISASHVRQMSNRRTQWGTPVSNPNYRHATPDGNSHLPALAQTVPPNSRAFNAVTAVMPGNGTCFQTCDGAQASSRMKRSTPQQCPADPTASQAFFGSED